MRGEAHALRQDRRFVRSTARRLDVLSEKNWTTGEDGLERAMRATLHTDGAARHKLSEPTGPAGIGAVLRSESGEIIGEIAKGIGLATNNVAEYTALIEGLQMALDAGVTDIDAYIDSPVVAGHLLKGHRVKADHLR